MDIETDRKPSIQGDLTKIPFKEKSFDLVLSMQVLEHIMDDKKALQDLISVTKDNGTLIISVPFNKKLGSVTREYGAPNWEEFGHVREYGMDVVERFKNEGRCFFLAFECKGHRFRREERCLLLSKKERKTGQKSMIFFEFRKMWSKNYHR